MSLPEAAPEDNLPPGPKGLPWIGCTGSLLSDPMNFFKSVALKFGGIARLSLKGGRGMYLVSEPRLIKELLIDQRNRYTKNLRYPVLQRLLGDGLLTSEGSTWRRQRLLTQPAFKPAELDRQVGWMSVEIERYLRGWNKFARSGEAVDVEAEFLRLTQLLAGTLAVGPAFESRAERIFEITEAIRHNWPVRPRNLLAALFPAKPGKRGARLDRAIEDIEGEMLGFIRDALATRREDSGILGVLIDGAEKQGQPFTEKELRDQLINLFFAGFETTAAAMCWTLYVLSQHPKVGAKAQQEVDTVLQGRLPTHDELDRLDYLDRVLQESLRLYSPVHSLSRVAVEDNTVGGYLVPKGCTAAVSLYATHRLPQHWPDPDRFDPDRFLPEACAARSSYAYIPFAVGHRNCIGGTLAMLEGKLIVAQIVQRYRLDLAPGERVEPYAATTMRPRNGLRMIISRRPDRRDTEAQRTPVKRET